MTIITLKTRAKNLRRALESMALSVTHSQALELVAKEENFPDWNAASASLANKPVRGKPLMVSLKRSLWNVQHPCSPLNGVRVPWLL